MGLWLRSRWLPAGLLLALLGGCSFNKADHPGSCHKDADCGSGESCYRGFCVQQGSSPGGSAAKDAGRDASPDGMAQAITGSAGMGSAGKGGGAGAGGRGASGGCQPNPDTTDEVCTQICPETCNNADDDCDRKIDEDEADSMCSLAHATSTCERGVCLVVDCAAGYRDCDLSPKNGCESGPDDVDNCGGCGQKCSFPNGVAVCAGGKCMRSACTAGFGDCDGNPADCETPLATLANCGGCGRVCENVAHATASCESGTCGPGMCSSGFGNCNAQAGDGCEQPLSTLANCGACAQSCDLLGSVSDCGGGVCLATACDPGYDECDGDPRDGCESLSSGKNCGKCGAACDATGANTMAASCNSASCVLGCAFGFEDCDRDPSDGCETAVSTLTNCGGCNTPCAIDHATATCATGACKVSDCAQGFGDCNQDGTSCETPLDTLTACGGCGVPCAKSSCKGGVCSSATCTAPTADCDGVGGTCEVNLATDANNCGACGNKCAFTAAMPHATLAGCSAMVCQITCDSGYANCNGAYEDGCETPTTTLTDCGGCAVACSVTNGSASCASGSCKPTGCDPDYGDCDIDPTDCETALNSPSHCGDCNTVCNLPNAVAACGGSVGQHTCSIAACSSSSFQDCDGSAANGCERDVAMNGPCLPDPSCTKAGYAGHNYYFCITGRSWSDARTHCQAQLYGDLARIDDAPEGAFVHSMAGSASWWVGGSDTGHPALWAWTVGGLPFWQGLSNGSALFGRYTDWRGGEPSGAGDCMQVHGANATGAWDEGTCSSTLPFVCEEATDACPSDASKYDPGQCGCGNPDTDSDGDGFAICNDACDSDPMKRAPGQCGCGHLDTDTDGDGVADCLDGCPMDKLKSAPGQCGCGIADTDTDRDGTPDCNDGCPKDAAHIEGCFNYTPSNYDPGSSYVSSIDLLVNCGSVTLDTTGAPGTQKICGTSVSFETQSQGNGGPQLSLARLHTLTVSSGSALRIIGSRPLLFVVGGDVNIDGSIDASSTGVVMTGAGGNVSCSGGSGHAGPVATASAGGGGGGGGAFGGTGANGGAGGGVIVIGGGGGVAGAVEGNSELIPLRGGCRGGQGGKATTGTTNGRAGGSGGGAIQISSAGTLKIAATAIVSASGGGGNQGATASDGGGGGGSGGAVLLEGLRVNVVAGARLTANAGAAASGRGAGTANDGQDGSPDTATPATGGSGNMGGGNGGNGATRTTAATQGQNGTVSSGSSTVLGGGGGGGAGVGRIRVNGILACMIANGAVKSPLPTGCP